MCSGSSRMSSAMRVTVVHMVVGVVLWKLKKVGEVCIPVSVPTIAIKKSYKLNVLI